MKALINVLKIIGVFFVLLVLVILSQVLGQLWHFIHMGGLEYILHGLTYGVVALLLIKLFVNKGLKKDLAYFRINHFRIYLLPLGLAILAPIIAIGSTLLFVPGEFVMTDLDNGIAFFKMFIEIVFTGGIIAPIVEETMFRGVLLKYIEDKTNIVVAIGVPSFLFGLVHILNGISSVTEFFLLIIAGTTVGIMFGVTAYLYHSIWASCIIHMFWNMSDLIHITTEKENYGFVQYIMDTNHPLFTGGGYGVDTSIFAIISYIIVIAVLLIVHKMKKTV
ncbi:CPBP family intramembrane glutamic endopeptidase [Staphylococcus auricularis]|uniref:Type II CAAX endopeptidase family protein n=1 Tax=Staphylococcus auricularis TaxID=29379 RepID=A0AAW7MDR7_9STAP|nr:type II CAAX endopeptidase family protein [Staphylococcus auricularis]MDC6327229.1 type II CAAX endopeptidase family protein [Staphylococcus auricularis]MDN4533061.1 type II CAAX endopeptidase family protein [Staphylococcus auricularis]MDN4533437.1 type II CAAX endopeptidase family protein [Staphylococcus auricularis]